jgi:hypothetical protein
VHRVHGTVDRVVRSSPWCTNERRGSWARWRTTGVGHDKRWDSGGSPSGGEDEEGDEAKLRGCSLKHGRLWRGARDRGKERRLELGVKVKWSVRELERVGKWCGGPEGGARLL